MASKRKDIDDFYVFFLYEKEGWTQREIADYYGVNPSTIHHRLHPEKQKEITEKRKEYIKEYEQSDKRKAYKKGYNQSDKRKDVVKKYNQSDKRKTTAKKYKQTENGKASTRKQSAKHRNLGYIELNEAFSCSEGHHIDEEHIIHIPKEIHHRIRHNVFTGQGMEEINEIAFQYITGETLNVLHGFMEPKI